ncbi:MAG TPA: DsbE family thiol:disulfide interchange protein [Azospirillaceae bacterium]|nr:DsbE family thiol:disulfide interchange protein [Azospirillaceae bacterium]
MRRLFYLLPLVVFAIVAGYFAYGLKNDPRAIPSALIDKPAPTFQLPPLPGRSDGLATTDLKGKVQLVNVWASWCVPCKAEHPVITRLAREYGIPVHGLNYKDKPEDAIEWLKRNGDPYARIGQDLDGRVAIDWGVYGVPETFLIDKEGRIRYKHVGPLNNPGALEQLLAHVKEVQG